MLTRTPMNRGKGFKRPTYVPPPAPPIRPATRRASYAGDTAAAPKTEPWRNRAVLDGARGQTCNLLVRGICQGGTETTVACHSNLLIHGKAKARKADDCYVVDGCAACHRWLDTGYGTAAEKEAVFMAGHARQVLRWRVRATDPSEPQRLRRGFFAALVQLGAYPLSEGDQA
jgi:hypothetical protein